jgi:predicted CxxxxCH...CXXCH cytochrome family protein
VAALAVLIAACDTARKVEETSAVNDCARCHGFPPPDPHPQSTACDTCHSTTVGAGNVIVPGGTHMNGRVDVVAHAVPYPPDVHGPRADQGPLACGSCHGADFGGGSVGVSCNACHGTFGYADWKTNCTFCHGTRTQGWTDANLALAAPPQSVAGGGDQTSANPKVGAHQAHLVGTTLSNPVACTSCHGVPVRTFPGSLAHIDATMELVFSDVAKQGIAGAAYAGNGGSCAVYCHGSGAAFANPTAAPSQAVSPNWQEPSIATLACNGCHGAPPATGQHAISNHAFPCNRCHAQVAGSGATPSIANKALHVNGTKDVDFSVSADRYDPAAHTCTNVACHGGTGTRSWYP